MEAFAWNQLERRNIDPMLRIIYKRFLTEDSMEAEQIKALYDICHAYEITTKGTEYEIYSCDRRGWNDHAEGAVYGQRGKGIFVCKDRPACMGKQGWKTLYRFYSI